MHTKISISLFLILLGSASIIQAQSDMPAGNSETVTNSIAGTNDSTVKDDSASEKKLLPVPETKMSSAVEGPGSELMTANELVKQTSNTAMVAGSCLVIDQFVRQFCAANPSDISCQFQ